MRAGLENAPPFALLTLRFGFAALLMLISMLVARASVALVTLRRRDSSAPPAT